MTIHLQKNTIYNIDCLKGIKHLQKQKTLVDIIVTSPPYNIGKKYHKYNDSQPKEKYLNWLEEIAKNTEKIMNENSSFFLNIDGKPTDPWIPFEVASCFKKYFVLQNMIHWIKSISISKEDIGNNSPINKDICIGHYQPVNSNRFLNNCHEHIFHFTKKGTTKLDKLSIGVPYQDKSNIGRWKNAKKDLKPRGNTWFIPYLTIQRSRLHPTVFPEKLPEMCIKLHGFDKNSLVLDPFMGTGSTAIACKKLNVDFIGFEIDKKYVNIANEKLLKT